MCSITIYKNNNDVHNKSVIIDFNCAVMNAKMLVRVMNKKLIVEESEESLLEATIREVNRVLEALKATSLQLVLVVDLTEVYQEAQQEVDQEVVLKVEADLLLEVDLLVEAGLLVGVDLFPGVDLRALLEANLEALQKVQVRNNMVVGLLHQLEEMMIHSLDRLLLRLLVLVVPGNQHHQINWTF